MTDRRTVFTVVLGLIVIVITGLASTVALTVLGHSVPDSIEVLTAGALGGVTGVLASTRTSPPEPPQVVETGSSATTVRPKR